MPLHPVPIILGGTLALIGSGYAFKKFVYDPHLAPLIEAFLASRQPHKDHYEFIPIPIVSAGISTARQDHPTSGHLRRRSRPVQEYELDPFPRFREDQGHVHEDQEQSHLGRVTQYELDGSFLPQSPTRSRRVSLKLEGKHSGQPLIDLDDEPSQVIFDFSPSHVSSPTPITRPLESISPADTLVDDSAQAPLLDSTVIITSPNSPVTPVIPVSPQDVEIRQPLSPTYSFFSLSRSVSRSDGSIIDAHTSQRPQHEEPSIHGSSFTGEDDSMSDLLSVHSMSSYADAEAYTPDATPGGSRAGSPRLISHPCEHLHSVNPTDLNIDIEPPIVPGGSTRRSSFSSMSSWDAL
ncbi:hypothetical protein TREMEDRAFT_60262 [Tremella mesenterica DSM 1558]|uniref:uncharacterized protein n=1 Tax=Tremella mesenterica (strain ATCC 24925 / CBS 8224 / DSM 1558 / NBRC 9311 / NRRL Y-6157 / RJB 2259-6 / UBC 559-6) TaxID=578456 RepID=UPI0003F48DEC|nr:uncharacterized protein TREMEDRAFT_60262 [Tremella mesenterica DSM 1558]EIW71332.1 hypothetical protein TREMEDRAFT_60262 [Tremella mesenterica DSM 1558]